MSLEDVAQRTAAKAFSKELATARALGYGGIDAYVRAFRVLDAVYHAAFEPDRPLTLTRFRPIGDRRG